MSTYKDLLKKNLGKILTNETQINVSLVVSNQKITQENTALKNELKEIKDSKLFKLWPIYCRLKKLFTK